MSIVLLQNDGTVEDFLDMNWEASKSYHSLMIERFLNRNCLKRGGGIVSSRVEVGIVV